MRRFLGVLLMAGLVVSQSALGFVQFGPIVFTTAGQTAINAAGGWLLSLLGAAGLYLAIEDMTGNQVRVPIADGAPAAVPAPSAPSTTSAIPLYSGPSCTNQTLATCKTIYAAAFNASACHAGPTVYPSNLTYTTYIGSSQSYTYDCAGYFTGATGSVTITATGSSCPAGYTAGGGTCNLSNARSVVPTDDACDIARTGTTLSFITDPDCSVSGQVKGVIGSGVYTIGGIDADGNPIEVKVTPLAGGGSEIVVSTQTTSGGKSVVQKDTVNVNSSGQVTGAKRDTTSGSIELSPTAQTATPTTGPSTEFPTDYARDATVAALSTGLSTIHTDLTSTSASAPSDPTVRPTTDISGLMPDSTFSGLKGWSMPSRSVSCPTWTFEAFGGDSVMDAHCTLWADASVGAVVQGIMLLLWALIALFLVLGA